MEVRRRDERGDVSAIQGFEHIEVCCDACGGALEAELNYELSPPSIYIQPHRCNLTELLGGITVRGNDYSFEDFVEEVTAAGLP